MAQTRDYKAEYARRKTRGIERGLSPSQARGHARANEGAIRPRPVAIAPILEAALREYRRTGNLAASAKSVGVSPERASRYFRQQVQIEGRGRTLKITDKRKREMMVISNGDTRTVVLRDADQASLNGQHLAAVRHFLSSNDRETLAEFQGQSVIDAKGKSHPLETDPNTLYRLAARGGELFHEVYKLIPNGG